MFLNDVTNIVIFVNIIIPNSVEVIGRNVLFGKTILNGIKLLKLIKIINNNTFIDNKVNTIPNSVVKTNDGAFFRCAFLTYITPPSSITKIGIYYNPK